MGFNLCSLYYEAIPFFPVSGNIQQAHFPNVAISAHVLRSENISATHAADVLCSPNPLATHTISENWRFKQKNGLYYKDRL